MKKNLKTSEAQRRATAKYQKANRVNLSLNFVRSTEGDLIEALEKEPNKAGYIKRLIREDIAKGKPRDGRGF